MDGARHGAMHWLSSVLARQRRQEICYLLISGVVPRYHLIVELLGFSGKLINRPVLT